MQTWKLSRHAPAWLKAAWTQGTRIAIDLPKQIYRRGKAMNKARRDKAA